MTELATRRWVLRDAFALLRVKHVLAQIALGIVVFVMAAVWLQLSDASWMWLAVTVVLGVAILIVAGGGEAALLLAMMEEPRTRAKLLRGAALVLLLLALWWGWCALLAHHGDDSMRASYWNSKLPRRMRYWFSYTTLVMLQGWFWSAVEWVATGLLAAVLLPMIPMERPMRATVCALKSVGFWCVLVVGLVVASVITDKLLDWSPGHGLAVESLSLVLRLVVCCVMDAAVICLVLAVIAACVRRVRVVGEDGP